ncbi:MAG: hypothetical protein GY751_09225 [Bacteroidetes bacterium]|nr:hypothetical protein [Bacteroidota bacterium]
MFRFALIFMTLFSTLSATIAQTRVEPFLPETFMEMPYVRDMAISKDGKEIFFTVDDYKHTIGFITTIKRKRKKWGKPEVVSFSGNYRDIEPFLSHDGKRLYFASNRPVDKTSTDIKDYDLWYVERSSQQGKWSEPVRLPEPVNSTSDEYYPSLTASGDLYFTAAREGSVGTEDIFMANNKNGEYQDPISILGGVNSESYEFNAFVDPTASYIIFTSYRERDGRNRSDLYISRKTVDGKWGKAQLIPDIYSNSIDYCPFVDPQGNRLFFTSERNNVSPSFEEPLSFKEFMDAIHNHPNGLGRIYSVDFQEVLRALD